MSTTVEVFIDYVCPFCFLVEGTIDELKRECDVNLVIRPFELRPKPIPTLRPEDDYLPRIWKDSVYPMSHQVGIPISLPSVSPQPRTQKAFMVLQLAQEHGLGEEYSHAIFKAFFQEDQNTGDDAVIIDAAVSVGLTAHEVQQALLSEARRIQHAADQNYASQVVGITSVPRFRVNDHLVVGVPSATQLKKTVNILSSRDPAQEKRND